MMGAIKGVGTILKSKYPQTVLWHCLSHRLELAVSDTIKAVGGTQPIEDLFCKIYTIYSQSAKMQRDLKIIEAEINIQPCKVHKILTTRWVASSSRAVESFWRNYPALYKHFLKLSQSNDKHKATYAGLAKRMDTIEFVEDVAIMKDCLGQLSILSESLQKNCTTLLKASDCNAMDDKCTRKDKGFFGIQRRRVKIISVSKWIIFIQSKAISTGFD